MGEKRSGGSENGKTVRVDIWDPDRKRRVTRKVASTGFLDRVKGSHH